jgi:hypothetical protein
LNTVRSGPKEKIVEPAALMSVSKAKKLPSADVAEPPQATFAPAPVRAQVLKSRVP